MPSIDECTCLSNVVFGGGGGDCWCWPMINIMMLRVGYHAAPAHFFFGPYLNERKNLFLNMFSRDKLIANEREN